MKDPTKKRPTTTTVMSTVHTWTSLLDVKPHKRHLVHCFFSPSLQSSRRFARLVVCQEEAIFGSARVFLTAALPPGILGFHFIK